MGLHDLLGALATYVTVLARGAAASSRPEERVDYGHRLAAAAELFAAVHRADRPELRRLIDQEEHRAGWGFLPPGGTAEAAFAAFVQRVRIDL